MLRRIAVLVVLLVSASVVPVVQTAARPTSPRRSVARVVSQHLPDPRGWSPRFAAALQDDYTVEGIRASRRASLFDLGIYGGGAYTTDWFTEQVNGEEFGAFELHQGNGTDFQSQFFQFNLNDTLSVNRRLTDVNLNTRSQVGDYGGFRIFDITNPSAPRVIETDCSTSRFRIATATGRMRVDPTGRGEPKVFTGNFRIRIFRDQVQVGNGCPEPFPPAPCPDIIFEFPSDDSGTLLQGTYDVSSGLLNLQTGLIQPGEVFVIRLLQHRSSEEGNFGFDPNSGTWFLDPPPGPSFGGSLSGPVNDPFRVSHACGSDYDRYPVSVTDTPSLNTRFDFVPPPSQQSWSNVYDALGRYIFAGVTLDF